MRADQQAYGDDVISTILADREHTVVLIIDMQNDFCAPGGVYDQWGLDISAIRAVVDRLRRLAEAARQAGVPVLYLQQTTLPGGQSDSTAWRRFKTRSGRQGDYAIVGTWGHRIVDELAPAAADLVVQKFRSSGFTGTSLEVLLGASSTCTLVVGGCETDGCVASTVRDAQVRDYTVLLVEDCLASTDQELHRCAMTVLRSRFPVLTCGEVEASWARRVRDP